MMMELLSRCYVNQEARQAPKYETGKALEKGKFVLAANPPPPLGVVNRQGISREWPPRIGARKKQNLPERMSMGFVIELLINKTSKLDE